MFIQSATAANKAADKSGPRGRYFGRMAGYLSLALALFLTHLSLSPLLIGAAMAQTENQPQSPTPAPDGATRVERHQDWTLRCGENKQTLAEACYMVQVLSSNDSQKPIMLFAVERIPAGGHAARIMLPLGIRLPDGITLEVTGRDKRQFPFVFCLPNGCQVQFKLNDDMVTELKSGIDGKVVFKDSQGRAVVLPVSLKGFTAAFTEVK